MRNGKNRGICKKCELDLQSMIPVIVDRHNWDIFCIKDIYSVITGTPEFADVRDSSLRVIIGNALIRLCKDQIIIRINDSLRGKYMLSHRARMIWCKLDAFFGDQKS